jgi:hypothetical protein
LEPLFTVPFGEFLVTEYLDVGRVEALNESFEKS